MKPSFLILLKIFTLCTLFRVDYVIAQSQQNVLLIHSYDASYEWTRDFHQGIEKAIDSSVIPIKLSVEYLDTKRLTSDEYYQDLNRYFRAKYSQYRFDGVLITDDNALRFFNQLDLPNLKQLPTIAGGIGDLTASLFSSTEYGTVLYEEDYIEENLALIRALRPDLEKLYYLADYSYSSILLREWLLIGLKQYPNIELVELREGTLAQASHFLSGIAEKEAVLLTHFNTELKDYTYHGYSVTAQTLSNASTAPVFVLWDFYLDGDVLGGYVHRSNDIGIQMVQLLGSKLNNPVRINPAQTNVNASFQYHALKKFNISELGLPNGSTVLGKPASFFDKYRNVLILFISVGVFMMLVIIILGYLLKRKRELHKKDKTIVALQKQTLQVQKNLINVLGESIETRSGETGNHVYRVAKLSAHLAKLHGLSTRECEILEIISPMHDVGKIGIPEAILNKPGKLTPQEWVFMQSHVRIGYKLLYNANGGDIMNLAAIVSLQHHERWDGKGYPDGLNGDKIHVFARITTIADVFDALRSKRCYKDSWPIERVIDYFKDNSGKQFDPNLTKLLLDNRDEFIAIRRQYPD